jgi:hypothetical protein
MSISDSIKLPGLPIAVNVSIPTLVGSIIGQNIWDKLTLVEQTNIETAAKAILENYTIAIDSLDLG